MRTPPSPEDFTFEPTVKQVIAPLSARVGQRRRLRVEDLRHPTLPGLG
jgi:hypothetical protein